MGFTAQIDQNAAKAAEEAASGGNGTFLPLPKGKYQATVFQVKGVERFGGTGGNADKQVVRIGFKIIDESPNGKGRVFFERIPLFTRYAPSEKSPEGAVARSYFDFWERAMGVPREQVIAGTLPDNIGGKRLTITLGAPIPPDSYNTHGSNEIAFYDKEGDLAATPTAPVNVPWLDANGKLVQFAGSTAPAAGSQAALAAAVPPANLWGQEAPAAPAAPAAQSANPWGQPAAADPLLAQAAANGQAL